MMQLLRPFVQRIAGWDASLTIPLGIDPFLVFFFFDRASLQSSVSWNSSAIASGARIRDSRMPNSEACPSECELAAIALPLIQDDDPATALPPPVADRPK
jgi:hypothetical protein